MTCFHFERVLLVVIAMVSATLSARAEEALPTQDQAVARALENHPEIVATKAKVALEAVKTSLEQARLELQLTKERVESGASDNLTAVQAAGTVRAAEGKLVEAIGRREQAEKELRLLIGTAAPKIAETTFDIHGDWVGTPRQMPQSQAIDKWKAVEAKPIRLEFHDIPLEEVLAWLSEESGVKFSLQHSAFEAIGLDASEPVTLTTYDVPLSAALQSFEDVFTDLQFVLRDYGVLLTTKEVAENYGYAPVLELGAKSAAPEKSR
jgi:hypothetical protein